MYNNTTIAKIGFGTAENEPSKVWYNDITFCLRLAWIHFLDSRLSISSRYTVPKPPKSLDYSSDPEKFSEQYFGFLSCEGQGLERAKGSNTCKDAADTSKNKNPFAATKVNILEFDFLTGKDRPKPGT